MMKFSEMKYCYKSKCKRIADFFTPFPMNVELSKWERKSYWLRKAGLVIGKGVAIDRNFLCITGLEENITIEDHVAIGVGVKIWNYNSVLIGKFSTIAAETTFVNGGHDINSLEPFSAPLTIGRGCWIGNGARIVGPLSIGNNSIVGAGSVVLKNVPEGAIVAGVPAKIIRYRQLPDKVWHLGNNYFSPTTFELIK